ncbi:hypothetical protein CPT_Palo_047 [Rhizobium phage Palo]|uniref:Cell wall hydrolase SleB domain-containing protein n=1 Tax=Rhizobium phage Palo TaxID=2767573 RepID=A0A7L8G4L8_9CAUD|nr:hypothetical protein CPT_Palo_047 [Rhizobium phage Palo]
MADLGRREEINDPLALNPREKGPDRSLPTYGIRNPGISAGNAASKMAMGSLNVIDGLMASANRVMDSLNEDAITEGKLMKMQGKTDEEIAATGNKYTMRGAAAIESNNNAQGWFADQLQYITDHGQEMDPEEYRGYLMKSRKEALEGMKSADPAVRKMWAAAFEDYGPRLAAVQTEKHNDYNKARALSGFTDGLMNGGMINSDASVPVDGDFRVNQEQVQEPVADANDNDRDIVIRTMLGEAGGEGNQGMAAVAHVIVNRARDPRWPGRLQDVALQENQFSAWNKGAGGNDPLKWDPKSPAYQRAGQIYDAVISGHHIDPTNGAVNYWSPGGMNALVAEGSQTNREPRWRGQASAESGGEIRIGNHIFSGKSAGSRGTGGGAVYRDKGLDAAGKDVQDESFYATGTIDQTLRVNGMPTDAVEPNAPGKGRGSQLQRYIMNSPIAPKDKAAAVADAMIRSFSAGDDSVFNDAGGMATLVGLGATSSDMMAVRKAQEQFAEKKDKEYDGAFERARSDLLVKAQTGNFANDEEAFAAVEELYKGRKNQDGDAKALARQVMEQYHKADKDTVIPLALRDKAAFLKEQVDGKVIDSHEAGQQLIDWGKQNGIKDTVVNTFVSDMYSAEEAMKQRDKTTLATELKKQGEEKQLANRASAALKDGYGLKGIGGTIRIPDPVNPGKTKTVTGEEYGIYALQKSTMDDLNQQVQNKQMTQEEAGVEYIKRVYENLSMQGVYDKDHGRELSAAVSGNLIDKKTGAPSEAALHALDEYMQMRDNPKIGEDYLSGMIEDDKARTLLTTAALLYDGRQDFAPALIRANELLQEGKNIDDIKKASTVEATVGTKVRDSIRELTNRNTWVARLFPSSQFSGPRIQTLIKDNTDSMVNWVSDRARTYQLRNSLEPMATSVEKARGDMMRQAVVMGGSIIMGDDNKHERLDQVMGLEDFGRDTPDKALRDLLTSGTGDTHWGELWRKQNKGYEGSGELLTPKQPRLNVVYNKDLGMLEVNLYKDGSTNEFVGEPLHIDAKLLGQRYLQNRKKNGINPFTSAARKVTDDIADKVQNRNAGLAGNAIGGMFKPKK